MKRQDRSEVDEDDRFNECRADAAPRRDETWVNEY